MSCPVRYLVPAVCLLLSYPATGVAADTVTTLMAMTGEAADDFYGYSVAAAGDVNGDGYADVIIGAYLNATSITGAGRAYIYYGGPGADAIPDVVFTGQQFSGHLGFSVASAGDVNGDGFGDVIVGAFMEGPGSRGRAYVFYGGSNMDTAPDLTFDGVVDGELFGDSVSGAGDMNGDGYDDLIVGTGRRDGSIRRVYVYFGGPSADSVPDLTLSGADAFDEFGDSVSGAGDFNDDGFDDVIVGAYTSGANNELNGRAFIYYGGEAPDATADLVLAGESHGDLFGLSVASAGDFNGDGIGDVIVGAFSSDVGAAQGGRAYVFYGGQGADNTADLAFTGAAEGGELGISVSSAGDVNGDGFGDVIVGAFNDSYGGPNAGRAFVYYGGPGADTEPDIALTGEAGNDRFGFSVSKAGDVNGDGLGDVVAGAFNSSLGGEYAGRAYVFSIHPEALEVRLDLDPNVINLASSGRWVTAYLEPSNFDPATIDVSSLLLAGTVHAEERLVSLGDHNGNGVPDLAVKFSRPGLNPLLTVGTNRLEVTGRVKTGAKFAGSDEIRVINPTSSGASTVVAPNPLNPAGTLAFRTALPGNVTLQVFDLSGRLVRRLIDSQFMDAGAHTTAIDGRADDQTSLPTGVYFYRLDTTDETTTGKFTILK